MRRSWLAVAAALAAAAVLVLLLVRDAEGPPVAAAAPELERGRRVAVAREAVDDDPLVAPEPPVEEAAVPEPTPPPPEPEPEPPADPTPPVRDRLDPPGAGGPVPGEAPATGTILGRVVLEAEAPERPPLAVDPACCEGVDATDRSLVVGPGGGVASVVVELETGLGPEPGASRAGTLTASCCRLDPPVLVLPPGSTLRVANRDEVHHDLYASSPLLELPPAGLEPGASAEAVLEVPGRFEVRDAAWGWMSAWVVVGSSPHVALTSADGRFRLDGVPAGSFSVAAWHPVLGGAQEAVDVVPGETAEVELRLGF